MGLDTTHDCWHGAYSSFMRWRVAIAKAAGIDLLQMEGYYGTKAFDEKDPLTSLLLHSDCEGSIALADCAPIADRLEALLPLLPQEQDEDSIRLKTQSFIKGLRLAVARGEDVEFH